MHGRLAAGEAETSVGRSRTRCERMHPGGHRVTRRGRQPGELGRGAETALLDAAGALWAAASIAVFLADTDPAQLATLYEHVFWFKPGSVG